MMTVFVGHIFNNKSDIFSIEGIQTWQPLLASGNVRQLCVDQDRLGGAVSVSLDTDLARSISSN
jgi:hypothetical protein